jgi:ribosomal protein L20A (L18A)
MKKKYLVEAVEEVFYQKVVEAENEEEAYEVFYETAGNEDIVDGVGFEVTRVAEVENETI